MSRLGSSWGLVDSAYGACPAVPCRELCSRLLGKRQRSHPLISRVCEIVFWSVGMFVPLQAQLEVCARGLCCMFGAGHHALRRRLRVETAAAVAPELGPPRTLFLPLFCEVAGRALLFLVRLWEFSDGEFLLGCVEGDDRSRVIFGLCPWCCLVHSLATKKS